jgi:hypothetical protein
MVIFSFNLLYIKPGRIHGAKYIEKCKMEQYSFVWNWAVAMKKTTFYNELIKAIDKVYMKVALKGLQKRMAGYHQQVSQSTKSRVNDIKSPLLDYIDTITIKDQGDPEELHTIGSPAPESATANQHASDLHTPAKNQTDEPYVIDKNNVGELSRYFKEKSIESELHPGIEEKLEHSVWEHIHATIKYARQGDKPNAKMHTDIANSACEELAHYMSEEDYLEFIMKIKEHLDVLKSDKQ